MNKICLILTTTVYIHDKLYIYQKNTEERLKLYIKSIKQWLDLTHFYILVVDNSGYTFPELKEINCNDRFQIISFKENEIPEANYLLNNKHKGASELFSINYAFTNSKFFNICDYVIKVTGRYFIPQFEKYIYSILEFDNVDALCQNEQTRCEFLGCKKEYFNILFNISLKQNDGMYNNHIEFLYNERLQKFNKVAICKKMYIDPTQQGGINKINYYL